MKSSSSPGFLLTMGKYYGTLAAVRCLGAHGVPVIMADRERLAPARWSCHVARRVSCPPVRPIERFMDWLHAFGAIDPGHVLYATCDDLAWAFAAHEADLRRNFRLLSPPLSTVARLLDKRALYAACPLVGLRTPRTWFPRGEADIDQVAREAPFPLILKPRTQVLFTSMRKGGIVLGARDLRRRYAAFVRDHRYPASLLRAVPGADQPMVQEFGVGSRNWIYSISGFCDLGAGLLVARAARKLLQWPRRLGVGICFEDAAMNPVLLEGIRRLCVETGYFGVFEAEFVDGSDGPWLIDFNPRFFGQMGFDTARHSPLAYFAYLRATGEHARLREEVEAASSWRPERRMLFVNSAQFAWTRAAERLAGRPPAPSLAAVTRSRADKAIVVDAAVDAGDRLPAVLDVIGQFRDALFHPRSVLRAARHGA
jgi:D-aspartate ligase